MTANDGFAKARLRDREHGLRGDIAQYIIGRERRSRENGRSFLASPLVDRAAARLSNPHANQAICMQLPKRKFNGCLRASLLSPSSAGRKRIREIQQC
jgi:hypothetical protein